MYSFSNVEPVHCSMFRSNCCFLACIQVSQESGKVVWYSHLFKNIPQFVVIHIKTLAWSMKQMFSWNSLAFSMIQWMLAISSLVPLPFQNKACMWSHSVVSNSLRLHGLQYARPPCPSKMTNLEDLELTCPMDTLNLYLYTGQFILKTWRLVEYLLHIQL